MAEKILVVQGGKLIDGTGRPPIENSVIVIQAGRFQAVGRSGEVAIPAGAEVIDVKGKTVLPGFIDGHGHLEDFHGELYLHLGITTCANIELYQDGPWTLAQKQGTALGKIRGPRIWMSGRAIGGVSTGHDAFGSRTARGNIIVTTPEEVRRAVQRKKELGCDILKVNEFLSLDLVKVAVDEAHRLGMPVAAHSWDVVGSANAGVDAIEHIWSVGYSSIPYAPARRKLAEDRLGGVIDQEIAGAYYQTGKLRRGDRRDGGAPGRVDADHRQMAAPAVAERRALPRKRERNPERSQCRSAAGGARGHRQFLRQAAQALHARAARSSQSRL